MKWILIVLGILLLVVGIVWLLQGTNLLPYGQMAGHRRWIVLGAALGVVGVILVIAGVRVKRIAR